MSAYLVVPRPGDLGKAVILPLGCAAGALLTSLPSGHVILRAAVVWFAIEFLAYQARYQWNDIRGFRSDQLHPDCSARGRLPGPIERARERIPLSAAVAIVRVLAALSLTVFLPGLDLAPVLIPGVLAVFVVAVVYEWVRSQAGEREPSARPATACIALWALSGGGYCVRGLTGVVLGSGSDMPMTALIFAGFACWFAGIIFVTTRWAVESLPFASRQSGRLHWYARQGSGRGHLLALTRWLPREARSAPSNLRDWRLLWTRTPWHAPWNVAALVALGTAWLSGVTVDEQRDGWATLTASAGLILFAWLMIIYRPGLLNGSVAVVACLAAAAVRSSALESSALSVAVCCVYLMCSHQRLADVGTSITRWWQAIRGLRRTDRRVITTAGDVRSGPKNPVVGR